MKIFSGGVRPSYIQIVKYLRQSTVTFQAPSTHSCPRVVVMYASREGEMRSGARYYRLYTAVK